MAKSDLSAERLHEFVEYNQSSGVFTWRKRPHARSTCRPGDVASGGATGGYMRLSIGRDRYLQHRLAWLYVYGAFPAGELDHINGIKSDNRICNLREVSRVVNCQNVRSAYKSSASGFLGASYNKGMKKWRACIRSGGKKILLGYFQAPEQAHAAYIEAKRRLHAGCTI